MADTKITDLAALATPLNTDVLVVVDLDDVSMSASGTDKKVTIQSLLGGVTQAEMGYVSGVTSGLQAQIDAKGAGDALIANPLSQFAQTTSLQLKDTLSDETGSGAAVFATSPVLVTPALGTPSSGVGTNLTGTASGLTAGLATNVTTNANLTGHITSTGNAAVLGSFTMAQLNTAVASSGGATVALTEGDAKYSSYTAIEGEINRCDPSSSNISVSFPSSPSVGDMIGFYVGSTSGDSGSYASAPGYGVQPDSATKIGSITQVDESTGVGTYGLMLSGESLICRYVDSSVGWIVVHDGRIPMFADINYMSDDTANSSGVWEAAFNNAVTQRGSIYDTATQRTQIKRTGIYRFNGKLRSVSPLNDQEIYGIGLGISSSSPTYFTQTSISTASSGYVDVSLDKTYHLTPTTAGIYFSLYSSVPNRGAGIEGSHASITEIL